MHPQGNRRAFGASRTISAITGFVEAPTIDSDGKGLYYHQKVDGIHRIYRVSRHSAGAASVPIRGIVHASLDMLLEEIVTGNRILAHEGIVDSFGHVSARHPDNPKRFLLSRARAPERIEKDDIMEFTLEGEPVNARDGAVSRALHSGGIYEARPDVIQSCTTTARV